MIINQLITYCHELAVAGNDGGSKQARAPYQSKQQSVAWRAKYRIETKRMITPWEIVPHPLNHGGEVVKSARTKQIIGMVLKSGYDPVEASVHNVVIETKPPAVAGQKTEFQLAFERLDRICHPFF